MNGKVAQAYSPKYRIIMEELRSKILSGQYAPGETLPSQRALVSEYQVSLSTVRQSLGELTRQGVVRAKPGRGFFVEQVDGPLNRLRKRRNGRIGFACWASSQQENLPSVQ